MTKDDYWKTWVQNVVDSGYASVFSIELERLFLATKVEWLLEFQEKFMGYFTRSLNGKTSTKPTIALSAVKCIIDQLKKRDYYTAMLKFVAGWLFLLQDV